MNTKTNSRGFRSLFHPGYPEATKRRLVAESSAIGDYDDSMDKPGSSFLWVGEAHHLNREDVTTLRDALTHWLERGRLPE